MNKFLLKYLMINNILPTLARVLDPHVWLRLCEFLQIDHDIKPAILKKTRLQDKISIPYTHSPTISAIQDSSFVTQLKDLSQIDSWTNQEFKKRYPELNEKQKSRQAVLKHL